MADDEPPRVPVERWLSIGGSIVAPATAITALLFYFGYVSARAEYAYFGLDVDTIGLSTQDFVMRSPQPLLTPLLVLSVLGAGLAWLHVAMRRRLTTTADVDKAARTIRRARAAGLAVLASGLLLLVAYPVAGIRDWAYYPLMTPLLIASGATTIAYALSAARHLDRRRTHPTGRRDETVMLFLITAAIAACVLWATATVAEWSGRGLAQYRARNLQDLPAVVLDTRERLFLRTEHIEESRLPASSEQTYHYRYRGLRLLIQGGERMFLVPEVWSAGNSTLMVPLDDSVRVQFRFVNQPP